MRVYRAEVVIDATPEVIWRILTDAPAYPEWEPGMLRVEGTFAPGEKLSFFTKLSPERAFPAKVTTFLPPEKCVLTSGMPLGLFKTERTHALTPAGDGRTRFTTQEVFSGLLLPIIGRSVPDLTASFEAFAAGLKARAEAG